MILLKNFQTPLSIATPEADTTSAFLFAISGSPILKPYLLVYKHTIIYCLVA